MEIDTLVGDLNHVDSTKSYKTWLGFSSWVKWIYGFLMVTYSYRFRVMEGLFCRLLGFVGLGLISC